MQFLSPRLRQPNRVQTRDGCRPQNSRNNRRQPASCEMRKGKGKLTLASPMMANSDRSGPPVFHPVQRSVPTGIGTATLPSPIVNKSRAPCDVGKSGAVLGIDRKQRTAPRFNCAEMNTAAVAVGTKKYITHERMTRRRIGSPFSLPRHQNGMAASRMIPDTIAKGGRHPDL